MTFHLTHLGLTSVMHCYLHQTNNADKQYFCSIPGQYFINCYCFELFGCDMMPVRLAALIMTGCC